MDAYLSREAHQALEALILIHSSQTWEGLLIGHKRGHRYFVEKVFPFRSLSNSSAKKYFDLDQIFNGKLIGFCGFNLSQRKIKKVLAPFAYGKLVLQVSLTSGKKMAIKSFIIDYKEKFFLSPIQLKA